MQHQGNASHPVNSPSKLGLMINVSDPTSLLLALSVAVAVAAELSDVGRTYLATSLSL